MKELAKLLTPDQAQALLDALSPLMDACAEVKPIPSQVKAQGGGMFGFEKARWDLWRFAHHLASWAGDQRFYSDMRGFKLCGRPTKKGGECRRHIRWGRAACLQHMNPAELDQARQWQEQAHLPFPRITEKQVEEFGIAYWDRLALEQKRHIEAQQRQAKRLLRDLARITAGLESGKPPKSYTPVAADPQPEPTTDLYDF